MIARMLAFCTMAVLAAPAFGSAVDEAKQLKDEAHQVLQKASGMAADPKLYAEAVRKLEKAEALLEAAAQNDPKGVEVMQQEVTAALFWARRFANVNVISELQKDGGGTPATPKPAEPPKTVTGPPPASPAPEPPKAPDANAAETAYKQAEAYEKSRASDHYAVALRWFQVADQHPGTEWSLRALGNARAAQERFRAQQAAATAARTDIPEDQRLIAQGDELMQKKKFDEALAKYDAAKKSNASVLADRKIGHAHLAAGYAGRDEYAAKYLPVQNAYNDALRRGDRRKADALRRQAASLVAQLRPLEQKILKSYDLARGAFQSGLNLSKNNDLDCEAHLAILEFEKKNRFRARPMFAGLLRKYTPANDEERTVYEYCKTLLRHCGG